MITEEQGYPVKTKDDRKISVQHPGSSLFTKLSSRTLYTSDIFSTNDHTSKTGWVLEVCFFKFS